MPKITKAVIPVAGLGTRFLPATKAMPKEMLPVVDKPVVQYLVEETVASGIKEIIFITGRGKRAIEDHFDVSYELEDVLFEKNKKTLLNKVRKISSLAHFSYVRQSMALGDGHAILQAARLVGNEPVLIVFGDSLYDSRVPTAKQLISTFNKYGRSVIGLSTVDKKEVSKFGVVGGTALNNSTLKISTMVEKPKPKNAPSNLAIVGKYVITPDVFNILSTIQRGQSGEIRLIDAFNIMLARNKPIYGKILQGTWFDTGDKLNFLKATIHFGLKHPEIKRSFAAFLRKQKISS